MHSSPRKKYGANNPVRIGLVGCGRVAEFGYIPAFRQARGVTLAGVADVNLSRCEHIAPGVPAYENVRALINAGSLDALVIAIPTRFHVAAARCGAEAGLPALLEKPPGVDVGEAGALQSLNPPPWIAFNRRFEPGIASLKEELPRDGHLDLLLELHYRKNSWKSFDMQDDVLLDLGPHLIDLARWLTDSEIQWARAHFLHDRRIEFELALERAHAIILCSNNRPHREQIEAKDELGRVRGYRCGGLVAGMAARLRPNRENPLVISLAGQLEAFGDVVRGTFRGSPLATVADGLMVMSAIDAVRRSAVQDGAECALQIVRQIN